MINYKTVKLIDGDDFNSLVRETYGKPYFLQQQNYCMRGLVEIAVPPEDLEDFESESLDNPKEDMGVSFKAWLEKEPEGDDYHAFWERHFYPSLDMVVNDLYEKGLLEEGEYHINLDV